MEQDMTGFDLKTRRKQLGLTQQEASARMGVSQPYVALLEMGKRKLSGKLLRKAMRLYRLGPEALPPSANPTRPVGADQLARELAALGYPGFAYMKSGWRKNPGEVLVAALAQSDLESRVTEALPWLVLNYPELDKDWLVAQARLGNLSNRLGFVVDLAKSVAERQDGADSSRVHSLAQLKEALRASRLADEGTLCQESLSVRERDWLRENRSDEARFWHLLTKWRPEHLQYAA
jgi:transcriptional regulator with XRE-family HTH domain